VKDYYLGIAPSGVFFFSNSRLDTMLYIEREREREKEKERIHNKSEGIPEY
jgi:hypothetical protein